jgi:PAS domain S-box-containing protein
MSKAEISRDRVRSLGERFQTLFAGNVAGTVLSTPEGQIVDCNDAFVGMFGYDSRADVLAGTAWDFYFDRADRDAYISATRVVENYQPERRAFRHKTGAAVWAWNTRMIVSHADNRPELLLSTAIDITEQLELENRVRELSKTISGLPDQPLQGELPFASFSVEPEIAPIFTEMGTLLYRINQSLRPDKLGLVGKSEAQQFVWGVERMKVLVQDLEVYRLTTKPEGISRQQ